MSSSDNLPELTEDKEIEEYFPSEEYDDVDYNELCFIGEETPTETTETTENFDTENSFFGETLSEEDAERFKNDVARLTSIAAKNKETNKDEIKPEKRKINYESLNECLIVLVICLLILLVGQRYLMQKREKAISVIYEAVNETTTEKAFLPENGKRININTANADELMTLDGIGKQKAEAILDYRLTYGKFREIADIMDVPGIGEGIFEKIKDLITVQ